MEEFFHEVIQLQNPTPEQRQALARKYGMEQVGPSLISDWIISLHKGMLVVIPDRSPISVKG